MWDFVTIILIWRALVALYQIFKLLKDIHDVIEVFEKVRDLWRLLKMDVRKQFGAVKKYFRRTILGSTSPKRKAIQEDVREEPKDFVGK